MMYNRPFFLMLLCSFGGGFALAQTYVPPISEDSWRLAQIICVSVIVLALVGLALLARWYGRVRKP